MTQNDMILDYLNKYGSITQAEAVIHMGCYRLGARIWDLKRRGVKIKRCMETSMNRFGVITCYARYTIQRANDGA